MNLPQTLKPGGLVFRLVSTVAVGFLALLKMMRVPKWLILSSKLRSMYQYWNQEMFRNYVFSLGRKLPHDQMCTPREPDSYEPKVQVSPEHQLTETDIRNFYHKGYLEPFSVFDAAEMEKFSDLLLKRREEPSDIYGFVCDRDRHLDTPEMMKMIAHPAISDRLAQLLGPNLEAWRSQIFYKAPGGDRVGWHQASTFMFEESFSEPAVVPPDLSELFQLTVWIAVDSATRENGCLQMLEGSLFEGIRWMRLGGKQGFHAVNYFPDYEVDMSKVNYVEMERGQVLIFAERTLHCSDPNKSDSNRLAFNFRAIPSHVQVYWPGKKEHVSGQMEQTFDLTKWRSIKIRGNDDSGPNHTAPSEDYV
ncbi:MAG: non-heme Fe2+,alpha-ketoglutarate-dependent halogenase [Verrucomicrobiales bacterium]|jgi:non-heme Fe2+,alpha-ketoglutarate-dependent halogenase